MWKKNWGGSQFCYPKLFDFWLIFFNHLYHQRSSNKVKRIKFDFRNVKTESITGILYFSKCFFLSFFLPKRPYWRHLGVTFCLEECVKMIQIDQKLLGDYISSFSHGRGYKNYCCSCETLVSFVMCTINPQPKNC